MKRLDNRGVSVQVGAIVFFGMLVVAMALHQSVVIPQENKAVEFEHQRTVERDLEGLRNDVVGSALTDAERSSDVTLGTGYPPRITFVNPPPAVGTLQTTTLGPVVIDGATATGETGDYWNGSDQLFLTDEFVYTPQYTELQNPTTTRYEHSVLYEQYDTGNVNTQSGQVLVDGQDVTVVVLNGSYRTTQVESASVDLDVVSGSTRTVTVTNGSEPLTLTLSTNIPEDDWRTLLEDELDLGGGDTDPDAYITGFDYNETPDPNRLTLTFERNKQYQLRMAKVGVGREVDASDATAHYIVDVEGNATGVSAGGRQKLVAEVRDRYNNPISGVEVNVTGVPASRLSTTTATTDTDGRVEVTYTAPSRNTLETPTMTFGGGSLKRQSVDFAVSVGGATVAGGNGSVAWETTADWDARSDERGVVHESNSATDWPGGGTVVLGYPSTDESGSSLVSYWPLDEDTGTTTNDIAGPYDGDNYGADPDGSTSIFGRTAYEFSESEETYVYLGDVDAFADTNRLTISAWFYADTFPYDGRIISKSWSYSPDDTHWMMNEDEGVLEVRLRTGGSVEQHRGPDVDKGTWEHAVMTYNGSYTCVYVDAGTPDCFAQSGEIPETDARTYIGANSDYGDYPEDSDVVERHWNGELDEIRLYNRSLSQAEVQNLYDASTSGYLVTGWKNDTDALNVSDLDLSNVDASVPSGTSITVYVESDTDGDGTADETSNAISVNGATETYAINGLSTDTDTFRLRVELSSTGPTRSPTLSAAEVSSD